MANFEVLSLDPTTPQIRAPGAGDGYSVPRDMTFATGTTLNAPTTVVSVNTSTDALRITQVGSGNAIKVEDSANPDASPFVVTSDGLVGVGVAAPVAPLSIGSSAGAGANEFLVYGAMDAFPSSGSDTAAFIARTASTGSAPFNNAGSLIYRPRVSSAAGRSSHIFYTGSPSAERLRIDESGNVGIGTASPATNLSIIGTGIPDAGSVGAYQVSVDNNAAYNANPQGGIIHRFKWSSAGTLTTGAGIRFYKPNTNDSDASSQIGFIVRSGISAQTQAMTLDSSGNLGLGVTPSAWNLGKAIEVGTIGNALWGIGSSNIALGANIYYSSGLKYANTAAASYYQQSAGIHYWYTAASGTAGNAITFTQAMTLDASGNLLVGTTTIGAGIKSKTYYASATAGNFIDSWYSDSGSTENLRAAFRVDGGLANYSANDVNLSDERVKTDIAPVGSYWDKIKNIEIVAFKYKNQTHDDNNIGVIAQQVESVAPEFIDVDGFGETPEDGVPLKTVYTTDLYHAAIKALQEAMARIEQLETKVAQLEAR